MYFAWLPFFSLMLQNKLHFFLGLEIMLCWGVWATKQSTECVFSSFLFRWISSKYKKKCCAFETSVISAQESVQWTRWLDTCIIAAAIYYACRHTPHLKHCRQQESLCCLSTVINVKSLKNSGNTSEKLSREKVTENTIAVNEDIAEFHKIFSHLSPNIPNALSHKNYETFLSWGNCFYSNLIPLFRLLSSRPECVDLCVSVSYRSADTTEYSATPPGPNTRW